MDIAYDYDYGMSKKAWPILNTSYIKWTKTSWTDRKVEGKIKLLTEDDAILQE